jgi:hypothetical protein
MFLDHREESHTLLGLTVGIDGRLFDQRRELTPSERPAPWGPCRVRAFSCCATPPKAQ